MAPTEPGAPTLNDNSPPKALHECPASIDTSPHVPWKPPPEIKRSEPDDVPFPLERIHAPPPRPPDPASAASFPPAPEPDVPGQISNAGLCGEVTPEDKVTLPEDSETEAPLDMRTSPLAGPSLLQRNTWPLEPAVLAPEDTIMSPPDASPPSPATTCTPPPWQPAPATQPTPPPVAKLSS